jgi:hypothetical protein
MYLWFTCALCKNHNRFRSPLPHAPEAVPIHIPAMPETDLASSISVKRCWRPLGGLVSLRLKRGQTWNSVSASTGAGGASFTGGCSTDASS